MQKTKKWLVLGLGSICFLTVITNGIWRFKTESMNIYNEYKLSELKEASEHQAYEVHKDYQNRIDLLHAIAQEISTFENQSLDTILHYTSLSSEFTYLGMSDAQGYTLDSAGHRTNISERSYFKEVMAGKETSISNVLKSTVIEGDNVQIIAVPYYEDGVIHGCVYGVHTIGLPDNAVDLGNFKIQTAIVDANGVPVTVDRHNWLDGSSSIWDFYNESEFVEGDVNQIAENMKVRASGHYILKHKDEERLTYYTPLDVGEYYIFSNLNISFMQEMIHNIEHQTRIALRDLMVAVLVFAVTIWIFSKMVITQQKKTYENIVSNEKLMQMALQNSEIFLFEYDIKTGCLKRKSNQPYLIFKDVETLQVPEQLLNQEVIDGSTYLTVKQMFEYIEQRESVALTIQTTASFGSVWLEIFMRNIYDDHHRIMNTIGWIKNITEIKKQEAQVKQTIRQAQRDGLTGLYNSQTAIERINQILHSPQGKKQRHLLIFMDLDNFKQVNDTFGHPYGNEVLVEMSQRFANAFRKTDIVGRFGGDEFFAFLVDVVEFRKMEHLFKELLDVCDKEYERDGKKIHVSASFGIALAPEHGEDFETLASKADAMLLEVKKEGKKNYRLYQEK